jgi:hypothetical protein
MEFPLPTRILTLTAALAGALPITAPAGSPARWSHLDATATRELALASDARLEQQRGGALERVAPLAEAERAFLAQAQRASNGLEHQRGGDVHLTDREVKIILWTALVIGVIILIA